MSPDDVTVRPARPEDGPAFLKLVDALAEYEELDPPSDEAKARLLADAFGTDGHPKRVSILLAEADGDVVAYAILLETYSSFLARPTLYLEDIFVDPAARRRGVANAMLRAIAREALDRGCHRIEGVVLSWNEPAHAFYRATGGEVKDDWWLLRYDRATLEKLADG